MTNEDTILKTKETNTFEGKGSGLGFGASVAYALMPNLSLEAGFDTTTYTFELNNSTIEEKGRLGGSYVGARYTF